MSAQIVKTAFDRPQRELGCEFMDWEGWYWPSHFGDAVAEHQAVRTDVGVWDASPLRKWDFRGRDALAAAEGEADAAAPGPAGVPVVEMTIATTEATTTSAATRAYGRSPRRCRTS